MFQRHFDTRPFQLITWLNALVGTLMLIIHKTSSGIPFHWQLIYFLVMITMTGIPHGALDHVIAMETANRDKNKFTLGRFLGKYIIIILLYSAVWLLLPAVSLLFFLMISAWHFGETDIEGDGKDWGLSLARITWGTFVLMVILISHAEDVKWIIMRITHDSSYTAFIFDWIATRSVLLLSILLTISLGCLFYRYSKGWYVFKPLHIVNLCIVLLLCTALPLLPAFALYFGGWHAVRSFEFIFGFLKTSDRYSTYSPLKIWREALPMTFLAVYGLLFMIYIWNASGWRADPIPILFIFLSVITLPHLDVMDKMLKTKSP